MDSDEYYKQLKLLGLNGPLGEIKCPQTSLILQVFKMPDGSMKYLRHLKTDDQRASVIETLRLHLGIIEQNRKPGQDPAEH
jgi:hypothetical protein